MDKRFDPSLQCHHTILLGDLNYRLTYDHRLPTSHKVASDAKNAIPADEVESELSAK